MGWSPEMELIDQLKGSDLPLSLVCRLLGGDEHARKVLGHYLGKEIVVFARQETVMPIWQSLGLLRSAQPLEQQDQVRVSLTNYGAKAFENGTWETI
jgi:hypothetical protein